MHEIAAAVGSAAIILIGIIFGILFNQRALDRLEARMDARLGRPESRMDRLEARIDRIEADLREFFRSIGAVGKAIDVLEKRA